MSSRFTRRTLLAGALLAAVAIPVDVLADAKLAGTYTLVSITQTTADGKKTEAFGPNPVGMMVLGTDGRYINLVRRPELPKFVSNNRMQGTADENKAVVEGVNAHYGRYSVQGDAIMFNIEKGSFPNWDGTTQKRLYKVEGDILRYVVPTASGGGTAEVVWRRAK